MWIQRDQHGRAERAGARRVALVLPEHRTLSDLEPLLGAPVPAIDGLVLPGACEIGDLALPWARLKRPPTPRELVTGPRPRTLAEFDHALWLWPGETLLTGHDPAVFRQTAQETGRSCLMPVHYALGDAGMTLLSLEPRWVALGEKAGTQPGFLGLPIESPGPRAGEPPAPRDDLAWAVLYRAIYALLTGKHAAGFAMLEHFCGQLARPAPAMAALAARNGLAAALALNDLAQLDRWAAIGRSRFATYPEVQFLCALAPLFSGSPAEAVREITALLDRPEERRGWISGGGETTYRALTFRGRAHASLGALNRAIDDWSAALSANSDYLPPLRLVAENRLHPSVLDRLGLRRFGRGRSRTAAALVDQAYAQHSRSAAVQAHGRPGVRWEGPFFTDSSLARINREIGAFLAGADWDFGLIPTEPHGYDPWRDKRFQPLADRQWHVPGDQRITVRHHWPPAFHRPEAGCLVIYLPWEYGAIPRAWVDPLREADEVWVYSGSVARGLIRSGLDAERVHVVPCGVDPQIFHPAPGDRSDTFSFLYVGGLIPRKGYELALEAFLAEFGPEEPVTLTLKAFGSATFYRASTGLEAVRAAQATTASARRRIEVIDEVLADELLARLYQSADCLLAPYRAEGFCLPALEAMACGTPAILPAFGPALDYASPDTALLVDATPISLGDRMEGISLAGEAAICQVPLEELRRTMRWAFEHRDRLPEIGERASASVIGRHTWAHAARVAAARLQRLC